MLFNWKRLHVSPFFLLYSSVQMEMVANLAYLYSRIPILRPYSAVQLEMAGNLSYLFSKIEIFCSYSAVQLETAANVTIFASVQCCLIGKSCKST